MMALYRALPELPETLLNVNLEPISVWMADVHVIVPVAVVRRWEYDSETAVSGYFIHLRRHARFGLPLLNEGTPWNIPPRPGMSSGERISFLVIIR